MIEVSMFTKAEEEGDLRGADANEYRTSINIIIIMI